MSPFWTTKRPECTTDCERALLNRMGGGCQVPIGALAEMVDGRLHLEAVVARPDGTKFLRESGEDDDPVKLGESVGGVLLSRGGVAILREVYGHRGGGTGATLDCVVAGDSPACCDYFPSMKSINK